MNYSYHIPIYLYIHLGPARVPLFLQPWVQIQGNFLVGWMTIWTWWWTSGCMQLVTSSWSFCDYILVSKVFGWRYSVPCVDKWDQRTNCITKDTWWLIEIEIRLQGRFTHEAECPWPKHCKHSYWWKSRSRSQVRFTSLRLRDVEGPTEYVNARWMWSLHGFLHAIKWIVFSGHLDYLQKPPPTLTHNRRPRHSGISQLFTCYILSCVKTPDE